LRLLGTKKTLRSFEPSGEASTDRTSAPSQPDSSGGPVPDLGKLNKEVRNSERLLEEAQRLAGLSATASISTGEFRKRNSRREGRTQPCVALGDSLC
jgi:hypothetical protein